MKYLFILTITVLLLFNLQKVNGQVKRDTIYYLLDTAKVPVKDRMFQFTAEGPTMGYTLACKCFPYGYGIFFYYQISDKKERRISIQEFRNIKTVSITELIDLALKCLPPRNRNQYQFIFAEPEGGHIQLTDMMLWIPLKPRTTITEEIIKPREN